MDIPPRPDPVAHRAVVIGDSHGSRPMVREALRAASLLGADVVVSVGDFGIWPGSHGKQFLDVVETMAAARGLEVLVVPGNHDDYDQLAAVPTEDTGLLVLRDRVRAAPRGQVLTFGRFRWLLCGGAASIDGQRHLAAEPRARGRAGRTRRRLRPLPALPGRSRPRQLVAAGAHHRRRRRRLPCGGRCGWWTRRAAHHSRGACRSRPVLEPQAGGAGSLAGRRRPAVPHLTGPGRIRRLAAD